MAVAQIGIQFGEKGSKATILEVVGENETITREKVILKTDGKGKEALLRLINENL